MANKSSATNGTSSLTAAELKQWYDQNKIKIEKYTRIFRRNRKKT